MFERFTAHARSAVINAREQAQALGHNAVGVEHLLLGVLHMPGCGGAEILLARGVSEQGFRDRLTELASGGSVPDQRELPEGFQLPFTPAAKKALELALRESLALRMTWIGTEHLLLGILGGGEHLAGRILTEGWDLPPEVIRGAVIEALPDPRPRLIPPDRGVPVPSIERAERLEPVERSIGGVQVVPSPSLRRLLMASAALALDDGRRVIDIDDVWLALMREQTAGRLASELGVDEAAVRAAIERRDASA